LAWGSDSSLYFTSGPEILRVDADRTLVRIAGRRGPEQGSFGLNGPATDASTDGANAIAFDRTGDLFFAGGNTKTLYCVRSDGILSAPFGVGNFYPRGIAGLASGSKLGVVGMTAEAILEISASTTSSILQIDSKSVLQGIRNFVPNGIAVDGDSSVYVDTIGREGFADRNAIVRIGPDGKSSELLWTG
jgi:sugar lactone lactonase YvrE